MYRPSSGRRGFEYYSKRNKVNKPSMITEIRQFIKRKYGLSILNTVLLCGLIFHGYGSLI